MGPPDDTPIDARSIPSDGELRALAHNAAVEFSLVVPGRFALRVLIADGSVSASVEAAAETEPPGAFAVVIDECAWGQLVAASPAPRTQSLLALLRPGGAARVVGSEAAFAQHLTSVRRVIELLRSVDQPAAAQSPDRAAIVGGYIEVDTDAWGPCWVHHERAGQGWPLLCLPTAGSDLGQFHGLMSEPSIVERYELIAVDLPWHGHSPPPFGATLGGYALTSESYVQFIERCIAALALDRPPILIGGSMAGAAVVETAARQPNAIAAGVACQVGPRAARRESRWLRNPEVNQATHVPEWTNGLMSPRSPKPFRDQVWWGYSQGGDGVYAADIAYYSRSWDIDNVASMFGDATPPLVLMSGIYDYSVPPEATRELAQRIPGAVFHEMPELGHFPHAENPPVFAGHLRWALDLLSARLPADRGRSA